MTEAQNTDVENAKSNKQRVWNRKVEQVSSRLDRIGGEMDPGIIEPVAGLNVHGIPTSGSCEGHLDHGAPSPWVMIQAEERPEERFNNEKKICAEVAAKYSLTVEELHDGTHEKEWVEAFRRFEKNAETEAYKAWLKKNDELQTTVKGLIDEFYEKNGKTSTSIVSIESIGDHFVIHTGGEDYKISIQSANLSEKEKEVLAIRLREHQAEMKRFGEFLKQKFLDEPDD